MKTIYFFVIVLVAVAVCCLKLEAQEQKKAGEVYQKVDEMPVFPGGEEALMKFISGNVKYPDEAKKDRLAGKVFVSFVIDEKGNVADVKVLRGVHPLLDKESMRVISAMPVWQPGKEKGKAVKVQYTIPIQFALR
jgi:TonB family protein